MLRPFGGAVEVALDGPTASAALEEARAEVLGLALPAGERAFVRYAAPSWPEGLAWLGSVVYGYAARYAEVEAPRACLIGWNGWLQPHRDRTAPYPSLNGVVVLRHAAAGGALHIEGHGRCEAEDGSLILFDGQVNHEVTPITASAPEGYRASVCYYLPWDED